MGLINGSSASTTVFGSARSSHHPLHRHEMSTDRGRARSARLTKGIITAVGMMFTVPVCAATAIYKCSDHSGVISYRDTPCSTGQHWERLWIGAGADARPEPGQVAGSEAAQGLLLGSAGRLMLGMTDTQVLNLPTWGRPQQIRRQKSGLKWREEWIYPSTQDETRHLYFENGRLTDQADTPTEHPATALPSDVTPSDVSN